MKYLILLFTLFLFFSCNKEEETKIIVDLTQFEEITEQYPYENIKPQIKVNYYEIIHSYGGLIADDILFSSGQKCSGVLNQTDCQLQFDSLISQFEGFGGADCLPSDCFNYLKYQRGDEIDILTTTNELKTFFGDVDSKSEAILLVVSKNYNFSTNDKEIGAIRKSDSGYEILVTKRVDDCNPVQTNRFLLEVTTNGNINILQEEIYSIEKNMCI